jgi:hypothetical protein
MGCESIFCRSRSGHLPVNEKCVLPGEDREERRCIMRRSYHLAFEVV